MQGDSTRRLIAKRVNLARFEANVSITKLADELGISRHSLSDRLHGKLEFGASELVRIGEVLGVHAEDWLTDLQPKPVAA